jgi:predicted metal-dependent HD superfamily phosphohydrolase
MESKMSAQCQTLAIESVAPRSALPSFDFPQLRTGWLRAWGELGVANPDKDLFDALLARYAEPARRYHTLQHLQECLRLLADVSNDAVHPAEVAVALWFHDAIYDMGKHDNEARSAAWAYAAAREMGVIEAAACRIEAMILATRHDAPAPFADAQLLVDIDLAILGATPARFEEYEDQVREEYGHVSDVLFVGGRRAVLEGFMERPRLYANERLFTRFEVPARRNLQASLASLAKRSGSGWVTIGRQIVAAMRRMAA